MLPDPGIGPLVDTIAAPTVRPASIAMELQDAHARHLSVLERLELGLLPDDGLKFDEALPILWLAEQILARDPSGLRQTASTPGHVEVGVVPVGPMETRPPITIRGTVTVTLDTACVRCLSDVQAHLATELDVTLMFDARKPSPTKAADDGKPEKKKKKKKKGKSEELETWDESFPAPELLDDGAYDTDGIDLASIIREAILLAMQMNPTCADEPACDERTQAMLDEANRAAREADNAGDPRWAALAALRKED